MRMSVRRVSIYVHGSVYLSCPYHDESFPYEWVGTKPRWQGTFAFMLKEYQARGYAIRDDAAILLDTVELRDDVIVWISLDGPWMGGQA